MSTSDERAGRNETSVRAANERIADRRAELQRFEGLTPLLCECEDPGCLEIVRISADDYERVRGVPGRFVIVPGHPLRGTETGMAGDGWVCIGRDAEA